MRGALLLSKTNRIRGAAAHGVTPQIRRQRRRSAYFFGAAFGAEAFAPFCLLVFAVFFGLLSPMGVSAPLHRCLPDPMR
jgi:hypothetical protein